MARVVIVNYGLRVLSGVKKPWDTRNYLHLFISSNILIVFLLDSVYKYNQTQPTASVEIEIYQTRVVNRAISHSFAI